MTKTERRKHEYWWITHRFPLKRLIADVWHNEIKQMYPEIGRNDSHLY